MINKIDIKKPSEIIKITDAIHDCWFDLNEIQFDKDKSILLIPYEVKKKEGPLKTPKESKTNYLLQIKNVKDYKINDTEKIGSYDFNKIEYYEDKNQIIITTGVPLGFTIYTFGFGISIKLLED